MPSLCRCHKPNEAGPDGPARSISRKEHGMTQGLCIRTAALAMLAALGAHAYAAPANTQAVEFYNTDLQHYFITADATESVGIDSGSAGPGWVRTGRSFA